MQCDLQNSLLTNLKIGKKSGFKKPNTWPDIRKSAPDNCIRLLVDNRYPIGFTATVTDGYSVNIDGEHYNDYSSQAQFFMADWTEYTTTEGYKIDYPTGATKAHIIDIYPQTEGNNITAFHCARVADNGNEEQGILWAHFNLVNAINLSKGFAYTEYYNDLLTAVTAKKNLIISNGLDYCFYNALSLEYLPKIDYSNVSDMTNFITNASNLKINVDVAENSNITKIGCYGSSSYTMTNFKELRVSNEAPFNNATSPQINVSYTGMDRTALTTLFNDLPYNVGYNVTGTLTINDGVVSDFSDNDFCATDIQLTNTEMTEFVTKINIPSSSLGLNRYMNISSGAFQCIVYSDTSKFKYGGFNFNGLGDLSFNKDLSPDTDYWIKYTSDGTNCTAYVSIDGVNYMAGQTKSVSSMTEQITVVRIGKGNTSNKFFAGSINLNETYIKVNDIYWFRGQPAMTKTLSCVGATGTADLTQDDKDIALNKGWAITY